MIMKKLLFSSYGFMIWVIPVCISCMRDGNKIPVQQTYAAFYMNSSGDENGDGTKARPWKTINQLNNHLLKAGDTVYFEGGQTFSGNVSIDISEQGEDGKPLVFTSTGKGKAIIDGGNSSAITINRSSFIEILNLSCIGNGRKNGNTSSGVVISNSNSVNVDSVSITGFQKAGLLVFSSSAVNVKRVHAFDNGFAGISISGEKSKDDCKNIIVSNCLAENNPGDPTNLTNHSGNGIIAGLCKNVTIEYCVATNNGWDMPRKGNGPVGIWTYESDSVIIQHCVAYRNKTSSGASDGGGFDLDGGVTNTVIQYCLSYENEGSGYGLFQYAGASKWSNNVIRYNISENDGAVTANCGGILVWNSSGDPGQLKDCYIYNNTIYNAKAPAIVYSTESENQGFRYYNNVFVGKDEIVSGKEKSCIYLGNNWFSISRGFSIDGKFEFKQWIRNPDKEKYDNQQVGYNSDPKFVLPGAAAVTTADQLAEFNHYQLPAASLLRTGGLDLSAIFKINNGGKTFNLQLAPEKGIGACF
jgi:hypothetical protein